MKSRMLIVCGIFVLYLGGFLVVRSVYENEGSVFKPNPSGTGYLPPAEYTNTCLFVRSAGAQRIWGYSLYYLFYPAGSLDQHFTGRGFEMTDERHIIY
jgi:hypothetical protein